MALITWDEKYSVKVRHLDNEHKKLVDLINQFHDAMREGKAKESMGKILNELISYTRYHFTNEEAMMAKIGYADLEEHKKVHAQLIQQVVDINEKFKKGSAVVSIQLMNFLKDWLMKHIQGVDKKYSESFNSKGIN